MSTIPEQLADAAGPAIRKLGKLPPDELIVTAQTLNEVLLGLQGEVAALRRKAVRELRLNHTLKDISEMTGISIARISQIELGYSRNERARRVDAVNTQRKVRND